MEDLRQAEMEKPQSVLRAIVEDTSNGLREQEMLIKEIKNFGERLMQPSPEPENEQQLAKEVAPPTNDVVGKLREMQNDISENNYKLRRIIEHLGEII